MTTRTTTGRSATATPTTSAGSTPPGHPAPPPTRMWPGPGTGGSGSGPTRPAGTTSTSSWPRMTAPGPPPPTAPTITASNGSRPPTTPTTSSASTATSPRQPDHQAASANTTRGGKRSVERRDVHVVVVAQGRVAVAGVGGVAVGVPAAAPGPDAAVEDHVLDAEGSGVGDGPVGEPPPEGAVGPGHHVDGAALRVVAARDRPVGPPAADRVDVEDALHQPVQALGVGGEVVVAGRVGPAAVPAVVVAGDDRRV